MIQCSRKVKDSSSVLSPDSPPTRYMAVPWATNYLAIQIKVEVNIVGLWPPKEIPPTSKILEGYLLYDLHH